MATIFNTEFALQQFHRETHQYCVFKVDIQHNDITLHYFDEFYRSAWMDDQATFKAFPDRYLVRAGGWYGDHGRWDTLKRIEKKIRCSGVRKVRENPAGSEKPMVSFVKSVGVDFITVQVFPTEPGRLDFICTEVADCGDEKIFLFDKTQESFINATDLFEGEFNFKGRVTSQNDSDFLSSDLADNQVMLFGSDFTNAKNLLETICPVCDGDDFIGCLLPESQKCPFGKPR